MACVAALYRDERITVEATATLGRDGRVKLVVSRDQRTREDDDCSVQLPAVAVVVERLARELGSEKLLYVLSRSHADGDVVIAATPRQYKALQAAAKQQ